MDERWKMVTYSFHASVVGRISGEISGRSVYEARQMNFSSSIYIYIIFLFLNFSVLSPIFLSFSALLFVSKITMDLFSSSLQDFQSFHRFVIIRKVARKFLLFFLFLEPFDTAGKGKQKIETDEIGNFIPGMENIIGGVVEYKNR